MPKINVRAKGARFEREMCDILSENGIPAKRNLEQVRDSGGDIVINAIGQKFNLECKARASMAIYEFWEQSVRAAEKINAIPCLALKANNKPKLFVISVEDLMTIFGRTNERQ